MEVCCRLQWQKKDGSVVFSLFGPLESASSSPQYHSPRISSTLCLFGRGDQSIEKSFTHFFYEMSIKVEFLWLRKEFEGTGSPFKLSLHILSSPSLLSLETSAEANDFPECSMKITDSRQLRIPGTHFQWPEEKSSFALYFVWCKIKKNTGNSTFECVNILQYRFP